MGRCPTTLRAGVPYDTTVRVLGIQTLRSIKIWGDLSNNWVRYRINEEGYIWELTKLIQEAARCCSGTVDVVGLQSTKNSAVTSTSLYYEQIRTCTRGMAAVHLQGRLANIDWHYSNPHLTYVWTSTTPSSAPHIATRIFLILPTNVVFVTRSDWLWLRAGHRRGKGAFFSGTTSAGIMRFSAWSDLSAVSMTPSCWLWLFSTGLDSHAVSTTDTCRGTWATLSNPGIEGRPSISPNQILDMLLPR
ncbi:hypothetical protein BDZ89DRAFT_1040397 [Hymenopellis radicata]|nr:hypothetical protein BDZ89DRAFT_1040397 [Hymenopellis radicata]